MTFSLYYFVEILNEIFCKLSCEDQTLRTFRRAIIHNVKADLVPFLIHARGEKLTDAIIRVLVNVTVPVECLFTIDVMARTEVGRRTVMDLNSLLTASKESFTDIRAIRAVVDYMRNILDKESTLSFEQCNNINNCLLLLRNILHIPEDRDDETQNGNVITLQKQIVWNMFSLSLDRLLIHLMSCPQRASWSVTMVQMMALIYKDQHVKTLQKLLNLWFEDSLSDCSEDYESNTSPQKDGSSGDYSPTLTSDTTSDSSDNGG